MNEAAPISEGAYLLFFLIVFVLGWVCGMKFTLWRIAAERKRNEKFWSGKKQKVLRRI